MIKERCLFHQGSKEDDGVRVVPPSLLFLRLSRYWHIKSPIVTLVPIANVVNIYGLINARHPTKKNTT